jgi:dihydrofolate synthase / folylpolyglutamate synthase
VNYSEAIQFLYGLQIFGANFGLENTFKLAALACNPQDKLRFIHIAGTNGKGSTCAMLESIYRTAGLRVGLFTSPHLVSFRERIQVNRQLISESDVARLVAEVAAGILPAVKPGFQSGGKDAREPECMENLAAAESSSAGPGGRMPSSTSGKMPDATLFEFATVMALKFFAEQKCDLVIWETGLGGRLDATNIVTPLACVITNIAFDHQQWLGDTLEKIAVEKAGIIKPGVPVITATNAPQALAVIESIAKEKNAPLVKVAQASRRLAAGTAALPLLGEHQRTNAALTLVTVEILRKQIPVTAEQIRAGLAGVNWPGRLQLVAKPGGGKILLDGAHNVAGVEALRVALESLLPLPAKRGEDWGEGQMEKTASSPRPSPPLREEREKLAFVIGFLGDKDWRPMCEILAPLGAKIFTVPVANGRTADAPALAAACRAANPAAEIISCGSLAEALEKTAADDFVVITGSLYLVGEALELLGLSPAVGDGERPLNEWGGRTDAANKSSKSR